MRSDTDEARRWLSEGVGVGRAVLVRSAGSSPFEVGSTLLVADDGRIAGSVSAGCMEGAAVEAVHAARRGGYREIVRYGVTDERAAEVGLSCGGVIEVLVEPELPDEVLRAAEEDRAWALASLLPIGREAALVAQVVIDETGIRSGSLGDAQADTDLAVIARATLEAGASRTVLVAGRPVYIEVHVPKRLVIVGAGEVAVHLVRLAHAFGFTTVVIDARSGFLTRERFPSADVLLAGWADEMTQTAGVDHDACVVALAHDPKFDDPAIVAGLRGGARYVGVLGSRRSHAARLARLREAGVSDAQLARIHAPIGLDLGGHRPSDIALGILAEIVTEDNRRLRASGQQQEVSAAGA